MEHVIAQADTPLHVAAAAGKVDRVKRLLDQGANVNAQGYGGQTALHKAAAEGQKEVVQVLLDHGADAGIEDDSGETPYHVVARVTRQRWEAGGGERIRSYSEVLQLLSSSESFRAKFGQWDEDMGPNVGFQSLEGAREFLARGGSVNTQDSSGRTPLHSAASHGQKDLLEFFIEKGAHVNAQDQFGQTPLHEAARRGREESVRILLAHEGDVNTTDKWGMTPLHVLAWGMMRRFSESLIAEPGAGRPGRYTETAELLLQAGATVSARDARGDSPLHLATANGYKDVAELLLAHGAEMNAENDAGETPLHRALWAVNFREKYIERSGGRGKVYPHRLAELDRFREFVEWLRSHGALDLPDVAKAPEQGAEAAARQEREPCDPSGLIDRSLPPLFSARTPEAAQRLLANGADVDGRDRMGRTPLHRAAADGRAELVEFLLDQGAHVNARTMSNDTPLHEAAENGQPESVRILLARGADVNAKNFSRYTPLHRLVWGRFHQRAVREASRKGRHHDHPGTATVLLENGAAVNARAEQGKTALHFAAGHGDKDLAKLFIAHGADVNARSDTGGTPLHSVSSGKALWRMGRVDDASGRDDYRETAEVLLGSGADVNATDSMQYTPLHSAAIFCNSEVAKLLVAHGADITVKCYHGETPLTGAQRGLRDTKSMSERMPADEVGERTKCFEEMIRWLTEEEARE
ncbi:MAG: ankyrin repeat domain-containing protein [Phycisphaerales bacterium]|nr:MAG: ankyrin repeat domain-containing protein [Phycisphaerales bacterium]